MHTVSEDKEEDKQAEQTESGDASESEQSDSSPDEESVEAAKEKVGELEQRYEPGHRPTVVVEGTGGTVAGTAFATDEDIEKHQSETAEDSDKDDDK
ncbi:MAG: hypothetical protein ABI251_09245 [Mycobacteriaceae bacterium]